MALKIAEDAAEAVLEGKLEKSRQRFATALAGTANAEILSLAFKFYFRTGDIDSAEDVARRWLAVSAPNSGDKSNAYGSLGNIHGIRGDLDEAEALYRKALALDEELGRFIQVLRQ